MSFLLGPGLLTGAMLVGPKSNMTPENDSFQAQNLLFQGSNFQVNQPFLLRRYRLVILSRGNSKKNFNGGDFVGLRALEFVFCWWIFLRIRIPWEKNQHEKPPSFGKLCLLLLSIQQATPSKARAHEELWMPHYVFYIFAIWGPKSILIFVLVQSPSLATQTNLSKRNRPFFFTGRFWIFQFVHHFGGIFFVNQQRCFLPIQVIAEMLQVTSWLSAWDPGANADAAMADPEFMASDAASRSVGIDADRVETKGSGCSPEIFTKGDETENSISTPKKRSFFSGGFDPVCLATATATFWRIRSAQQKKSYQAALPENRLPQKERIVFPTIDFRRRAVRFREGRSSSLLVV